MDRAQATSEEIVAKGVDPGSKGMPLKYSNLVILCNGCGNPMNNMGTWPVQWPKDGVDESNKHMQISSAYVCKTCRIPINYMGKQTTVPVYCKIVEG